MKINRRIKTTQKPTQIPTYIVGPFLINGKYAKGEFHVPFATAEKPLIPSINRGRKITYLSGGIETKILKDEMTRAPLLTAINSQTAEKIANYININYDELKKVAEDTTKYGKLTSIETRLWGSNIFLRMGMFCGDAAGHNMTTKAADAISLYLENKFPEEIKLITVSSNYCTDKKPSEVNILNGRGKTVEASVKIPRELVEEHLKTTSKRLDELNFKKNIIGSRLAGSPSKNSHHANIIAALYLATGQDIANVVEGSLGETSVIGNDNGDLSFSVKLPCLIVGTVGGGTSLDYAQENLKLMECYGAGKQTGHNSKKLAEIVAATTLCGELSLMATLTNNGELMCTHQKYEREKI